MDRIATKLLKAKGCADEDMPRLLAHLEVEMKEFRNRTGSFDANSKIWHSPLLAEGKLAEWHATSLLKTTEVFGYLGARTTGRLTGIGSAERNWGEYKRTNSKFRPLNPETAEKQTLIYGAAHMSDSLKAQRTAWTEADMRSDLGLEKFKIDIDMTAPRTPRRDFANYIEDWEITEIKKQTSTCEARLLEKYKGIRFFDEDYDDGTTFTICKENLEWKKGKGGGWQVIAEPDETEKDDDDDEDDDDDDNNCEPYFINETLHEMIRQCKTQTKGVVLGDRPEEHDSALGEGNGGGGGGTPAQTCHNDGRRS